MQTVKVFIPLSKWNDFEQKTFQELTGRNTQENLSEFIKSMLQLPLSGQKDTATTNLERNTISDAALVLDMLPDSMELNFQ